MSYTKQILLKGRWAHASKKTGAWISEEHALSEKNHKYLYM